MLPLSTHSRYAPSYTYTKVGTQTTPAEKRPFSASGANCVKPTHRQKQSQVSSLMTHGYVVAEVWGGPAGTDK